MQRVDDGRVGCGVGAFSDPAEIYLGLEAYRFQSPVSARTDVRYFLWLRTKNVAMCRGFYDGSQLPAPVVVSSLFHRKQCVCVGIRHGESVALVRYEPSLERGQTRFVAVELRGFQRFLYGPIDVCRVNHDGGLRIAVFVQQVVRFHQQLAVRSADTVERDTEYDLGTARPLTVSEQSRPRPSASRNLFRRT